MRILIFENVLYISGKYVLKGENYWNENIFDLTNNLIPITFNFSKFLR